jgi:hypothetical protein
MWPCPVAERVVQRGCKGVVVSWVVVIVDEVIVLGFTGGGRQR